MRSHFLHRSFLVAAFVAVSVTCAPARAAQTEAAFVLVPAELWQQILGHIEAQERELMRLKAEAKSRKVCL